MTQTIVLYRLVATIDVTFNQLALSEVDGSQLCQGRQAREVACGRRARMHKCFTWKTFRERSVVALRQHLLIMTHNIASIIRRASCARTL